MHRLYIGKTLSQFLTTKPLFLHFIISSVRLRAHNIVWRTMLYPSSASVYFNSLLPWAKSYDKIFMGAMPITLFKVKK